MQQVQVLTAAWYGDREVTLTFPDDWDLNVIAFEKRAPLSTDEMRRAFQQPIGSPRISEMARGKKSAVIIADDLTRPTPASEVIPLILEELGAAGIPDEEIYTRVKEDLQCASDIFKFVRTYDAVDFSH